MVVAERYELDRELGHGGMGSVWLAHHTQLDTPCAIKFIHAESATHAEVRARFDREAKAAAQIRSSHVVQILDYGLWGDVPYIAMEYLQGEDLAARLKRRSRLSAPETSAIVTHVARALTKAHAAGLVHRDLKPENIFLVTEDDQEIAKVLDFGIAKSHEKLLSAGNNTKTGSLLGTPHYMSPEQAQGTKTVDHRSDLWSLAVVAYRCLTGRLPFESDALGDLLLKIIVQPLPVPTHIESSVPPGFDRWWARATDRDPAGRFQSAKELADALPMALGISQLSMPSGQLSRPMSAVGAAGQLPHAVSTAPMTPLPDAQAPPGGGYPRPPMPSAPMGHDPLSALSFGPMSPQSMVQGPGGYPSVGGGYAPSTTPAGVAPMGGIPAVGQTPGVYSSGPGNAISTDSIQVSKTVNEITVPKRGSGALLAIGLGAIAVGAVGAVVLILSQGPDDGPAADRSRDSASSPTQSDDKDETTPAVEPTDTAPPPTSADPVASTAPVAPPPPPQVGKPPPPPSRPPPTKPPPPPTKPPPAVPPPPPPPVKNWGI